MLKINNHLNSIIPCLWFENQAEEAVHFYTSIFEDSKIDSISYYGKEGFEVHGQKEGTVLTVGFQINGQTFTALNGGPIFKFTEAVSFQVFCDTQEQIDYYWRKLSEGGEEGQCGWLKDKFGLSWQVVPTILPQLMSDPKKAGNVMAAFMQMKKFDIQKLVQS
jgi:predicted 3-demethylubiquinone-9 3-methyltransferase (glyoxalase superfamily)